MKICVYAESLLTFTSANPARGMLKSLLELRSLDDFLFVVRKGSDTSPLLKQFLDSCQTNNWRLIVDRRTRKSVHIRALLGQKNYCQISEPADVYLDLDMNYLGSQATPLIATVADLSSVCYPQHSSLKWYGRKIRQHALKTMVSSASQIVTISNFTKQELEKYQPNLKDKITVVYNGISDEWQHNIDLDRETIEHKLIPSQPYWIWWGYITKRKNINGLIRAYSQLIANTADSIEIPNLLLVGELGFDSQHLPNLIDELQIEHRVTLIPFQTLKTLIQLVNHSYGLLFPSHHEGFGLPVIEAMALGKPVLVSNRTALPEISGVLGITCNPESVEDLCAGMKQMLQPEQHSEVAVSNRKSWATNFTYDNAAQKYSQLIDLVTQNCDCTVTIARSKITSVNC